MLIDATQFPFVWIKIATPNNDRQDSLFSEFEELLARKESFVFLSDEGFNRGKNKHSPDQMKQTTLWMKRNKSKLKAFVKAFIHIEPSTAKRLTAKTFAIVYEKFWGYPMFIVATKDEALALAQKHLRRDITDIWEL